MPRTEESLGRAALVLLMTDIGELMVHTAKAIANWRKINSMRQRLELFCNAFWH